MENYFENQENHAIVTQEMLNEINSRIEDGEKLGNERVGQRMFSYFLRRPLTNAEKEAGLAEGDELLELKNVWSDEIDVVVNKYRYTGEMVGDQYPIFEV